MQSAQHQHNEPANPYPSEELTSSDSSMSPESTVHKYIPSHWRGGGRRPQPLLAKRDTQPHKHKEEIETRFAIIMP